MEMPLPNSSGLPRLSQYLGAWAMHIPAFEQVVQHVRGLNLAVHIQAAQAEVPATGESKTKGYMTTEDGIAVIQVVGTLTKYGSSLTDGPSTVSVRRALRNATESADVKAVMLLVDSPGGAVSGTGDLADDVHQANKSKPVAAYIEDIGASGAYWIASQAGRIVANPSALVGSIGTFGIIRDYSEMDAKAGIKTHVIRAGKFKGAGAPGTEVTDEQLAEMQAEVDAINAVFLQAVARGRGMGLEAVAKLADGRVHVGKAAQDIGLIDSIESFDAALSALVDETRRPRPASLQAKGVSLMAEDPDKKLQDDEDLEDEQTEEEEPVEDEDKPVDEEEEAADEDKEEEVEDEEDEKKAATITELRAALPNATDADLLAYAETGLTVSQATTINKTLKSGARPKAPGNNKGLGTRKQRKISRDRDDLETRKARELTAMRDDHSFIAAAKALAKEENISLREAKSRVANEQEEMYAEYRDTFRAK